jgi:hypothetical protein
MTKRALSPESMNLDAFPPELWTHTLTDLTPPHFPKFAMICKHFNEIYEGSWKELFQSHFSACQPKEGESWKAAYQREYRFPLCEIRTKCKEIKSIPLPFEIHCTQIHKDRLYLGGREELGIVDLNNYQWIKPFTESTGRQLQTLAVNEVGRALFIFTSIDVNIYASRVEDNVETTLCLQSDRGDVIALGLFGHHFFCLTKDAAIAVWQIEESGNLTFESVVLLDYFATEWSHNLPSDMCIVANNRLVLADRRLSNCVYDAVNQKFNKSFDIPENTNYEFIDGDNFIILCDPDDGEKSYNFQISVIDMVTRKTFTRRSSQEEQSHLHNTYKLLTHYTKDNARLVSFKFVDFEGKRQDVIQILQTTPD